MMNHTPKYTLIADSGSTKTDWTLVADGRVTGSYQTQGINPFHQDADAIAAVLRGELLPQLDAARMPQEVAFYGSGVLEVCKPQMVRLLKEVFPDANVQAEGDLLAAARAVCGNKEGIACILGTGANSGLYDGQRVVANTPALGYILGDEGSGAVLGRRLLNLLYKNPDAAHLQETFHAETGMTMADVIARVYRQPMANRWLASLSPFVHRHLDHELIHAMVMQHFRSFFTANLQPYGRHDLPVGFVGSIAWHYQSQLREAAQAEGYGVGDIVKSPMDGLIHFHTLL